MYFGGKSIPTPFRMGSAKIMKARSLLLIITALSFAILKLNLHHGNSRFAMPNVPETYFGINEANDKPIEEFPGFYQTHPISILVREADSHFQQLIQRQSNSLDEAVREYRRRYSIPPPPNFDKWYEFARRKGVQLVDEYDTIHQSLLPFWALNPSTIRSRAREALGYHDNLLTGLMIRDGNTVKADGNSEWLSEALAGMIYEFSQFLPDMDLVFNEHDEPRVVVQAERLSTMIQKAYEEQASFQTYSSLLRNSFTSRPTDINDGTRIDEVLKTRFNRFAHQATWTHSRLSCPLNSPAQQLGDEIADNTSSHALGELGFIQNLTAFTDVCMLPSLENTFGFFDRPNAYSVVHDLFPIFSQSKISTYQDILYPSPWYWVEKVKYNESKDMSWHQKDEKLYWRGSTTGGYSRDGGWRRQHRQRIVSIMNAPDKALVLQSSTDGTNWTVREVERNSFRDIIDVKFSHVGQCDDDDCDAQREFFQIVEAADQQDAWKYKHLLDVDGNAFSGRFYAFLKSKSLIYKMAMFREWHMEWLKPWLHYIPLSLQGDEWLELIRYFVEEAGGRADGERIAQRSREWAKTSLRKDDMEVWFFRLLLE